MDKTFAHAHGTTMVLSCMVLTSTGILLARYGRTLRFGARRQLLGKAIWFQSHRFILSLASLLILIGFFFILSQAGGQWVSQDVPNPCLFVHSVIGGIVVCCVLVQIWLALYRCHPQSRFRFIFNWSHRIVGSFLFTLSVTNIFLITFVLPATLRTAFVTIISIWAAWIMMAVILFEVIEYKYRAAALLMAVNTRVSNTNQNQKHTNANPPADIEAGTNANVDNGRLNKFKVLLFLIHAIVSVTLASSFIVHIFKW